jgi:hypothetical protein
MRQAPPETQDSDVLEEGPAPLPQTIVEQQMYEETEEEIPQEPVKEEKPVKKEEDEDLIPYW